MNLGVDFGSSTPGWRRVQPRAEAAASLQPVASLE